MAAKHHHHHDDVLPNNFAWASLLGLLSPSEYFVTIDHSVLWYRHVAWAKPKGEDLRAYVTQRFSSNMVVLSLMLGAQINVFFNSSVELTEMRRMMATETYSDLKFWIGIVIALDACVTIMALVATFTLWGMISSISDTNSHALIRSSIGQYVISMPPRFVVAALYLFVFWLLLAFLDLMSGPSRILLAAVVFFLFFQVIVPLSAFGRLIIHTGAMAKRRVLEENFEKELLPSGLHASLLIRAAGQRRKYTSAINQYKKKEKTKRPFSPATVGSSPRNTSQSSVLPREDAPAIPGVYPNCDRSVSAWDRDRSQSVRSVGSTAQLSTNTLSDALFEGEMGLLGGEDDLHPLKTKNSKHTRSASGDVAFPRPSLLNSVNASSDLNEVVSRALAETEMRVRDTEFLPDSLHFVEDSRGSLQLGDLSVDKADGRLAQIGEGHETGSDQETSLWTKDSHRQRQSLNRPPTEKDSYSLMAEWAEESSVRFLYDESPASIFVPAPEVEDVKTVTESTRHPRPSFLNRDWGLRSLTALSLRESIETPESSLGDAKDLLFQDDDSSDGEQQQQQQQRKYGGNPSRSNTERSCVEMEGYDLEAAAGETQKLIRPTDHEKTNRTYSSTK